MWYKNIAGSFFGLVTMHASDGRTDRHNYDFQDRASIAAWRGKKTKVGFGRLLQSLAWKWRRPHSTFYNSLGPHGAARN